MMIWPICQLYGYQPMEKQGVSSKLIFREGSLAPLTITNCAPLVLALGTPRASYITDIYV